MKTLSYAGGGITSLMPKLKKAQKGKKPLRYADGGSTSTQYISNIPAGGEEAYERLIGRAETLSKQTELPKYEGDRLADFTDLQKQGFENIEDLGPNARTTEAGKLASTATQSALNTSYKPKTNFSPGAGPQKVTAKTVADPKDIAAQKVGTDEFTDKGTAQQYMNPYMQNVVDIQKREAVRADDIARGGRNAAAVGQGAFGGSRQAIVEAEAARNLAQQQNDIQAQGSNLAYQQAMQQFNADQARGLQAGTANQNAALQAGIANQNTGLQSGIANQNAGLQAGVANQNAGLQFGNQTLEGQRLGEASRQYGATLGLQGDQTAIQGANTLNAAGNTAYNQGLTSAQTQVDAGGIQQKNVQQGLDQAFETFQRDQNLPYQQIGFMSDVLRGSQGSSRTLYETPAAPSPMQTLAGLTTLSSGLDKTNAFGARGGEVKSDAIGRGLARIAPDSVGRFASGGIIGFADGGDPQIAEDRARFRRWWDTAKDVGERSGAAIADVGTLVPRGLSGAYDTAVVRPMRAAGLPAGYLSGYLMPEGGDPGSQTPWYDRIRARDPQEPEKGKEPAKTKEAPKDDFKIADKKQVAATGIGVPAGAERVTAPVIATPTVGGGGRAQTMEEMLAAQKAAGIDYGALKKEGLEGIERVGAIDKKAAEEDVAGLTALHNKMGQASLKREERLKQQDAKLAGDSLIRTGLAILTADPKRGWLAATAAGATVGFAEYSERKEKLDLSMDALLEAREQADFAKGKDLMVAKRAVRTAERDVALAKTNFNNAIGLKETEGREKVYSMYEAQKENEKQRAAQASNTSAQIASNVAIHNAQMQLTADQGNANREAELRLYREGLKGKGVGAKPMTPDQYIDNVRLEMDALLKEGYDGNGRPWTRERAEVEARRRVDALNAGTTPEPSTGGWGKPVKTG